MGPFPPPYQLLEQRTTPGAPVAVASKPVFPEPRCAGDIEHPDSPLQGSSLARAAAHINYFQHPEGVYHAVPRWDSAFTADYCQGTGNSCATLIR